MSKQQRIVFLVLAAVVLVAAVVVITPGPEDADPEQVAATQSPAATATPEVGADPVETPEATPTPKPKPKVPTLFSGKEKRLTVAKGETVRFNAKSSTDEEVHVHGYDISKEAPANKTIRMSFKADIEGIFEIEFERSAVPIAQLRVEP